MTINVQPRGRRFQLRVTDKLLAKPFFHTFDTDEQARAYGNLLQANLDKGVVPVEMLETPENAPSPRMVDVIDSYLSTAPVAPTDRESVRLVAKHVVGVRAKDVTYQWVEVWVRRLKVDQNLAPGTIRKRVESLARVVDWHLLRTVQDNAGNPLRMLPRGYSTYSVKDIELLPGDFEAKADKQRSRRLAPGEYDRCLAALSGEKRGDRQRSLAVDEHFVFLFKLIVGTGLRLSEAFKLRWSQVDLGHRILLVEGSKGHRGELKLRNVPLRRELREWLSEHKGTGLVFPFWSGDTDDVVKASKRLTVRFGKLFEYAGLEDITEHDLRHEAACRWFELRRPDGAWHFSDVAICKIMGWSDYSMILRYASLRGEDLSEGLD